MIALGRHAATTLSGATGERHASSKEQRKDAQA